MKTFILAILTTSLLAGCMALPGVLVAPDVSGTWDVDSGGVLVLHQDGSAVSGTFTPTIMAFPLSGTVTGRRLEASVSFDTIPIGTSSPLVIAAEVTAAGKLAGTMDGAAFTASRR